jgi:hypothetical protein
MDWVDPDKDPADAFLSGNAGGFIGDPIDSDPGGFNITKYISITINCDTVEYN